MIPKALRAAVRGVGSDTGQVWATGMGILRPWQLWGLVMVAFLTGAVLGLSIGSVDSHRPDVLVLSVGAPLILMGFVPYGLGHRAARVLWLSHGLPAGVLLLGVAVVYWTLFIPLTDWSIDPGHALVLCYVGAIFPLLAACFHPFSLLKTWRPAGGPSQATLYALWAASFFVPVALALSPWIAPAMKAAAHPVTLRDPHMLFVMIELWAGILSMWGCFMYLGYVRPGFIQLLCRKPEGPPACDARSGGAHAS